ncbi:MAG: hypothetical protein CME32_01110 [Gimesia sp.]|nr:hypothetical protein [Gimesia sp.]
MHSANAILISHRCLKQIFSKTDLAIKKLGVQVSFLQSCDHRLLKKIVFNIPKSLISWLVLCYDTEESKKVKIILDLYSELVFYDHVPIWI